MLIEEGPSGEDTDRYFSEAWKKLAECGGKFRFKGCSIYLGLQSEVCNERSPCPVLVSLYARLGLHRYSLLKGKKFELNRVDRYVKSLGSAASAYYITLQATDMDMDRGGGGGGGKGGASSPPPQTCFEILTSEYEANTFALRCGIARLQDEPDVQAKKRSIVMDTRLPECLPSVKSLYKLDESEVQDNDDWIRLYVELAVAIRNRASSLDFKILEVFMDRKDEDEGLNTKNATFYIGYKDLQDEWLGKSCHRVAVVRRSFDEDSGIFCFVGEIQPKENEKNLPLQNLFESSSGVA